MLVTKRRKGWDTRRSPRAKKATPLCGIYRWQFFQRCGVILSMKFVLFAPLQHIRAHVVSGGLGGERSKVQHGRCDVDDGRSQTHPN